MPYKTEYKYVPCPNCKGTSRDNHGFGEMGRCGCRSGQIQQEVKVWYDEPKKETEETKDGICFIATATYGSPTAPEVEVFRQFRDKTLLNTGLGQLFVKFYYKTSPPLAYLIVKNPVLKKYVRQLMLNPLIKYIKKKDQKNILD